MVKLEQKLLYNTKHQPQAKEAKENLSPNKTPLKENCDQSFSLTSKQKLTEKKTKLTEDGHDGKQTPLPKKAVPSSLQESDQKQEIERLNYWRELVSSEVIIK